MSSLKRVLLFAPYFLPRRRVGSMRPFRFAIHLRDYGWEPTVLTIATPGQTLTAREAELLRDVRVLTLDAPIDRTMRSESQLGTAAARSNRAETSPWTGLAKTFDRQFPIDTWLLLFAARFRSMVRDAAAIDPHVIWATGDPWSGLVAGRWLSRRLRKPFVADFRDPWALSEIRSEGQWEVSKMIDRRSERRIIEDADLVMFQAERVEQAYRQHYAALNPTTVTIRNSFDHTVFEDPIVVHGPAPGDEPGGPPSERCAEGGASGGPPSEIDAGEDARRGGDLHIGFFGRFRAMSPATLMVDVLAEMHRRHPGKASRVYVDSFGALRPEDAEYARSHDVASQFVAHDAVPLEKALSVLRQFDLLLVSTETRRDHIIPAKIFEYLPTGRPILSLSRNPEVAEMLQRTGTGIQIPDRAAVADLLADCVEAIDRGEALPIPFDPQPREIMKHEARVSTGELARALDALVDRNAFLPSSNE